MVVTGRCTLLLAVCAVALCSSGSASASLDDQVALAKRFAPVIRLVDQVGDCAPVSPYTPIDVDLLFGEPTVALRGPWGGGDLVAIGLSASDLSRGLYEYHLDFPGDALHPGCGYLDWSRRLTAGSKPTVYAHVASDSGYPGRLALQYWLYYVFNDWNNLHEGDWEMIQLVFDAPDARQALSKKPVEVGYSQHEGAERAAWGESKLELVDGTHPVVHPSAGSHANYFGEALYLGSSASQGVGCDDTSGPGFDVRPVVRTIPNDSTQARGLFPWIAFEGRWGELQRSFYNGPTGPNLKRQWTEPIRWSIDWRDRSYAVPAGGAFGTRATGFFCGAVERGSEALRRLIVHPLPVVLLLTALIVLLLFGLSRATWRPGAPLRLARRRAWGQILTAAARMYVRRLPLFVGIGVLFLPISVLVAVLQAVVLHASSVIGIRNEAESGGILVILVVAIGTALTLVGVGLVQAATARALVEIDQGRPIGPLRAYRLARRGLWPLVGATVFAVVVVSLLATALVLVPIAVWLTIRWALVAPTAALEELSAFAVLRRSGVLVRQAWLKVASLTVLGAAIILVAGPLVGALLIILTNAPLWVLDLVAGVVYAVTMPFVALTTAYVYFDMRTRDQLAPEHEAGELPAEIDLST
jgi:hypothetical protein